MTEVEIAYQTFLYGEAMASMLQWWAGVSFGLIAVSYFAAKRINLFFVIVLLSLYILFSIGLVNTLVAIQGWQAALMADFAALESTSNFGAVFMSSTAGSPFRSAFALAVLGTFLGCIAYVVYAYMHSRRKGQLLSGGSG